MLLSWQGMEEFIVPFFYLQLSDGIFFLPSLYPTVALILAAVAVPTAAIVAVLRMYLCTTTTFFAIVAISAHRGHAPSASVFSFHMKCNAQICIGGHS